MSKKAAILDIDGTLIDSNYEHVRAWARAFRQHGANFPQAAIHHLIGMGGDHLVPHLLQCAEDDPRVEPIQETHGELYKKEYLPTVRPLPGADALLSRLETEGFLLCLASSAHADEVEHYQELLGVQDRLDGVVTQDDVEESKPSTDIFSTACRKLGIRPEEAILLGDSVWDAKAAEPLGIVMVALRTGGFCEEELRAAGAAAVYRDLPHLLEEWDRSPFGKSRGG
jgi:HAD superfamily hydrolase (TIGR01509 family)